MKNIIFDFGGVLLEWSADNFYLQYFNGNKEIMNSFYNETGILILNREFDRGVPFSNALKDLANKFPHYKEPILLWRQSWSKMLGSKINGSIDILHTLHKNGYNLYGLTNWSAETFPYAYYTYDFFHLFQDIVVSGIEKTIKPEKEIYEICLARNNINAEDSIFIDDKLENVIVAETLGIKGIHFIEPQQLYNALLNLGVVL